MSIISAIIFCIGGVGIGIGLRDLYWHKKGRIPDNDAEYVQIIAYSILIVILGGIALTTTL